MKVWNDLYLAYSNSLSFTKIRYVQDNTSLSYDVLLIFHKVGNEDKTGYINMKDKYVSWDNSITYLLYEDFESGDELVLFPNQDFPMDNDYLFWSDNILSDMIKLYDYSLMGREKQQVKPTDNSQDWVDTGLKRDTENYGSSCECDVQYRWVEDGEICDGVNKHKKLLYQYNEGCGNEWMTYQPEIYKVGELIELDSSECGTYEYRDEWDNEWVCGSYLNDVYGTSLNDTSKYSIKRVYIKKKDETDWTELQCDTLIDYKEMLTNSFECGWKTTKTTSTKEEDICGSVVKEKYPTLSNISDYNLYDVTTYHYWETAPYPTNTDNMSEDDWVWNETAQTYSTSIVSKNDCGCGYYYLQWDDTDEYSCGSELGDGYVGTSQYIKQVECKYCSGNKIGETDNIRWVVYDSTSCECGYREEVDETSYDYTYICGDDGYMYYKQIVNTYSQCVDGSNKELINTVESNAKASHSTQSETTCEYDEATQGDTTKVVTTYRTYYDENDKAYKFVECPDRIVENVVRTEKSADCGYKEEWAVSGSVCCGYIDSVDPILVLDKVEGEWLQEGLTFTSNDIGDSESTIEKIHFNVSKTSTLILSYDISSEANYDMFHYSLIDSDTANKLGASGTKSGRIELEVTSGSHYITLKYSKDGSWDNGRDNVIVTLDVGSGLKCNDFSKYNAEYFRYSIDGGENWIVPEPIEYRYGSLIEYNSPSCGYLPTLEQWVLVCEDVTLENADPSNGCVECQQYQGAPTLFVVEKAQRSYDNGKTWEDIYDDGYLRTRTQEVLEWKSSKCGYTGDTFENRWTNTYCENGHLYGTRTTWVSYDGGKAWEEVPNSSVIMIKEENSDICKGEQ